MRKSEIVIAIMARRKEIPPAENKIIKSLSSALKYFSTDLTKWDGDVEETLSQGIIRHVSSVRGDLSMQGVVRDIDIIIKRMECGVLFSC